VTSLTWGYIIDLGVESGIIKKTGAFFSYDETRLGHGRENAKDFLKQHQDLTQEIEQHIRSVGNTQNNSDSVSFSVNVKPATLDDTTLSPSLLT
jgi:recombination protein RecA